MAIRASRIAWVGVVVVAALSAWMLWHARQQPAPTDPDDAPWIGLPKSGMDATQPSVRMVLHFGFISEGWSRPGDSLAFQCGNDPGSSQIKERYVAYIGRDALTPSRKVVFDVNGQNIDISVSASRLFMSPPPPSINGNTTDVCYFAPVAHLHRTRDQLESIRTTWSDASLWHDAQDDEFDRCGDGSPVLLEACIDGRYAARYRNCNSRAMKATLNLWRAISGSLPPPPKPEWRDANGNLVPDPWLQSQDAGFPLSRE